MKVKPGITHQSSTLFCKEGEKFTWWQCSTNLSSSIFGCGDTPLEVYVDWLEECTKLFWGDAVIIS